MQQDKPAEMSHREATKRRYAKINWNAHLVPLVREAVAEFGRTTWAKGHPLPQVALRSEAIDRGEIIADSGMDARDALTVQFGVCPSGSDASAPPGYSRPLIAAGRNALVFAQDSCGAVAVFLYPEGKTAANPTRIGEYRNPAELTRSRIRRLLGSLFKMHRNASAHATSAATYNGRLLVTGGYPVGRQPRLGRI